MTLTRKPTSLWRHDYLAVGVETITRDAGRLPLSFSYAIVADRRVASAHHLPIAWWRPWEVPQDVLAASAKSKRGLSSDDLLEGMPPRHVFTLLERLFRQASEDRLLIVTHDNSGRLAVLLGALEDTLNVTLGTLEVLNLAVLLRAWDLALHQHPGEPDMAYYRHIERVEGPLPDLVASYCDECPHSDLRPGDRLFGALAAHRLYESHVARATGQNITTIEMTTNRRA